MELYCSGKNYYYINFLLLYLCMSYSQPYSGSAGQILTPGRYLYI